MDGPMISLRFLTQNFMTFFLIVFERDLYVLVSSSVYLYDLGKRLRAMFSHRQVDPGSAKILSFKERKLRGNTRIVKQ